jgi:endonuclease YncB( thermonuclease family)
VTRRDRRAPQSRRIPAFGLTPMSGWRGGVLLGLFLGLLAASAGQCVFLCADAAAKDAPAQHYLCGGDVLAHGTARRVIDGRTFVLDDDRAVRLAAIEVPALPEGDTGAPGGAAARDALAALLAGGDVIVRRADVASDRYGRLFGFASILRGGGEQPAQDDLLAHGFARVAARVGGTDCAAELLRRESAAREAKLGLWANSYYDVLAADNPADVLARRGRFALVEGHVVSVRESGATIYVNFGRRWTEDFTVTILKRNARKFASAGLAPQSLAGARVRVRGWIEQRGGPWIEAANPEQIELIDRK